MQSVVESGGGNEERPFPIVVIGASAGGRPALERFLSALPAKFGFALIFMQHLSPKHKNLLPDLLRSRIPGLRSRRHRRVSPYSPGHFTSARRPARSGSKRVFSV